jgi:uncharacterized protein (DUF1501 family)
MTQNRRDFLKLGSAGAMGATLGGGWLSAMAQVAGTGAGDYKALVCVFLGGGNDACGTVLPEYTDTASWTRYDSARGNGAFKLAKVQADSAWPAFMQGSKKYPVHPALSGLAQLHAAKKVALVANVGNIDQETNRSNLEAATKKLYRLRSHNDQTNVWLHGADTSAQNGWGGKAVQNATVATTLPGSTPANQALAQNFRSVSINANNAFGVGSPAGTSTITPYGLVSGDEGVIGLLPDAPTPFPTVPLDMVRTVISGNFKTQRSNLIERDYASAVQRAMNSNGFMSAHWRGVSVPLAPSDNSLAAELKTVMRVIKANKAAGLTGRQVFYVSLSGFDIHNDGTAQEKLLKTLNDALVYFESSMGSDMKDVVLFTASEFGRLLHSNGNGYDHGWGGHQFVMTAASNLRSHFVGTVPGYAMSGANYLDPQMTNDGALIPSISLTSYADELLRWFGITDSAKRSVVIPGNYRPPNAGLFV